MKALLFYLEKKEKNFIIISLPTEYWSGLKADLSM